MDSKSFKEDTNIPSLAHPKDVVGRWSIQIGAYKDQTSVGSALRQAKQKLPSSLSDVTMIALPLRTASGVMYRARLGGMTQAEANKACLYFRECLPISPQTTRVGTR